MLQLIVYSLLIFLTLLAVGDIVSSCMEDNGIKKRCRLLTGAYLLPFSNLLNPRRVFLSCLREIPSKKTHKDVHCLVIRIYNLIFDEPHYAAVARTAIKHVDSILSKFQPSKRNYFMVGIGILILCCSKPLTYLQVQSKFHLVLAMWLRYQSSKHPNIETSLCTFT